MNGQSFLKHPTRRIIGLILSMMMLLLIPGATAIAASGGNSSEGLVTLNVLVTGLEDNSDINVFAEKEIDGVLVNYTAVTGDNDIAIFRMPFGGEVVVSGEPVSGYLTPVLTVSLTQLKGKLFKTVTLTYEPSPVDILVTGVIVEPTTASLFISQQVSLYATVQPANATDKAVSWLSEDPAVASVDASGVVTALAGGTTTITVTTADGGFNAGCEISVLVVEGITDPAPLELGINTTTALPKTVNASLAGGGTHDAAVTWSLPEPVTGASLSVVSGTQYLTLTSEAAGVFVLSGEIAFSDLKATLQVTVTEVIGIPIETGTLNYDAWDLFIGLDRDTVVLTLTVTPEGADTSGLIWESSDPAKVQIEVSESRTSATVKALATGVVIISVRDPGLDPTALDSCIINISADPELTDPAYIAATLQFDPEPVDQFMDKNEVYIRCYNLPAGTYYIKVTDKGSQAPLGTGTIQVPETSEGEDFLYKLDEASPFVLTTRYSASYFVYMSREPDFPSGDDEELGLPRTFMDNFKISSPVPNGSIVVRVYETIDGNPGLPSPAIIGQRVLLCRELDNGTDAELTDYILYYDNGVPVYSDEVKMFGYVSATGLVEWLKPKETLKIGGYILLMELPAGYTSNLNLTDPNGEDGELVKEVHLTRNTTVYKEIVVKYN